MTDMLSADDLDRIWRNGVTGYQRALRRHIEAQAAEIERLRSWERGCDVEMERLRAALTELDGWYEARAAILAFLDAPELVEAMTVQMEAAEWSDAAEEAVVASQRDRPAYNRFLATSALSALRAAAGGEG